MGASNGAVTLSSIPDGDGGVAATLRYMRGFARDAIKSTNLLVRNTAEQIILASGVEPRHWAGEVEALQIWVRDAVHYLMDPDDVEMVQTPEVTLRKRTGDCDDKATLLASLLLSIGHPARFAALALEGYDYSHVLVQSKIADEWVYLETIIAGAPMGWRPPGESRRPYILNC